MHQDLLNHVKNNRDGLSNALEFYEEDPSLLRNLICEQGVELTPDQLYETVYIVKEALEIIDNE